MSLSSRALDDFPMKRRSRVALLVFIALILFESLSFRTAVAASLTAQEKRGKNIYLKGQSTTGRAITAVIGAGSASTPAVSLPCVNCHDADGRGKPEGGVTPSNIAWEALTKPYGANHPSGRKHPAYTERSVRRAITEGIDAGGNKLLAAMPKYQLTLEEAADLVAYLRRLGQERDPGLSEDKIRIATILPKSGPSADAAKAMRDIMAAYANDINENGGIHNRRIEFTVLEPEQLSAARDYFAIVGSFIAGFEKDVVAMTQKDEIPLVGPVTLFPHLSDPLNRYLFYVFSGLNEQARTLADFAAAKFKIQNAAVAVIYPEIEPLAGVVKAIEIQGGWHGWRGIKKYPYPAGRLDAARLVNKAKSDAQQIVFFLGNSDEAGALAEEAEKASWTPDLFVPGSLAGADPFGAARRFQAKMFLSFPVLPTDVTAAGMEELRKLAEKHHLSQRHFAVQVLGYSAFKILVEGLKQAGKDLSREKLVTALEGLYRFETGLTPLITYGPNRRIGALGSHVVGVNWQQSTLVPLSGWIEPKCPSQGDTLAC